MKKIISRLTMKRLNYNFHDVVSGSSVYDYVDKYGDKYMAHKHFFIWSFRVKNNI